MKQAKAHLKCVVEDGGCQEAKIVVTKSRVKDYVILIPMWNFMASTSCSKPREQFDSSFDSWLRRAKR